MATFNPAARQTYTAAQIQAYFERIQLPKSQQDTKSLDLAFLALLQRHQLANVPFENLALHYSFHHSITLDPLHVFEKIVERNAGRGGYCMENSCLFGTVLRSLGFDVVSIGAKVNEAVQAVSANKGWKGPKYDGW
jgi:arylamine N-acetyltransferase